MPPDTTQDELAAIERLGQARAALLGEMEKAVVGQKEVIEILLMALLCRGHVLIKGVPGLGKTLIAKTLAAALDLRFQRIQFTPDLMPADITGTDILEEDPRTGTRSLKFMEGPLFANLVLADEINRTPPKTQAALLQAMQEQEVTIGRRTYALAPPFLVIATQNPIEMEGTYPLPEAQLDRFMVAVEITYPPPEEEARIVETTTSRYKAAMKPVLGADEILALQTILRGVPAAPSVVRYAVALVAATRPESHPDGGGNEKVTRHIKYGASPRASQNLILGAKARAILTGRYHIDFEDVRVLAGPVLRHRLVLNFHARADGVDADQIIESVIEGTAVPEPEV